MKAVFDMKELSDMINNLEDSKLKLELLEKYAIALKLLNEIYIRILEVKEK